MPSLDRSRRSIKNKLVSAAIFVASLITLVINKLGEHMPHFYRFYRASDICSALRATGIRRNPCVRAGMLLLLFTNFGTKVQAFLMRGPGGRAETGNLSGRLELADFSSKNWSNP